MSAMTSSARKAAQDPKHRAVCSQCGEIHERCAAHVKNGPRRGKPCRRWPKAGTPVCRQCGGGAPQVRRAGQKRVAEVAIRRYLSEVGVVALGPPYEELELLAGKVKAIIGFIEEYLGAIDIEDWRSYTDENSIQLDVHVGLWLEFIKQADRTFTNLVKLQHDERVVRLREREATAILWVMDQLVDRLGLGPEARETARVELPALLELAAGGKAG